MSPPKGYLPARIALRDNFAEDLARFVLQPSEPLAFVPGQYATLALEAGGAWVKRAYSIASAPHEEGLEFYVERVEEGALTPRLWDLAEGGTVWVRPRAAGHFVLDAARRGHVMAATVTGLAPFLSMARHQQYALATGALAEPHRLLILHGASRSAELGPYREELETLAAGADWLDYIPTISRPWAEPAWTGEAGRVEDVLRKHADRLGLRGEGVAGYACGNPQMIDKAKGIFARAGFVEDAIHEEKYFTTAADAPAGTVQAAAPPGPKGPSRRMPKRPGSVRLKTVKRPPSS